MSIVEKAAPATKTLAETTATKAADESSLLESAIEAASAAVEKIEAEDQSLQEGHASGEEEKAPSTKKEGIAAKKAVDDDDDEYVEEAEPEELKTRIFMKAKKRAQQERDQVEEERRIFLQEKEAFSHEALQIKQQQQQIQQLMELQNRLFDGDDTAALELAKGRDLSKMWHALAAANDPNKRSQFQQKKEQSELEKKVDMLLQHVQTQQQQLQTQSLASREKELQEQAIQTLADADLFPAIHKRYNVKNEWEKEELLLRYTAIAEELHRETGETPNHPSFFPKVSKRLEKKLRESYLSGDSSKSSEPDASPAKSGQKPSSISASKLSARSSAQKALRDMTEEEKFDFAVREAEADIRRMQDEE